MGRKKKRMHDDHHHHHDQTEKGLLTAFALNVTFTILEIVGGILTNSIAILSDAVHDLGDTVAIGSAYFLERYSKKGRDKSFSYGYHRFSPFGALINSIILFAGSIFIFSQTIPRLLNPQEVHSEGMIWMSLLGIAFNGLAVFRLKKGDNKSLNNRAVMLHLFEDVLGWVAVLIGSLLMYFFDWPIIDPLLSLGITAYILWHVLGNFKKLFSVFLQAIPKDVDLERLQTDLLKLPKTKEVHDIHFWSLDGERHILSFHLVIDKETSREEMMGLKTKIAETIKSEGIWHHTVEMEFEDEVCWHLKEKGLP